MTSVHLEKIIQAEEKAAAIEKEARARASDMVFAARNDADKQHRQLQDAAEKEAQDIIDRAHNKALSLHDKTAEATKKDKAQIRERYRQRLIDALASALRLLTEGRLAHGDPDA